MYEYLVIYHVLGVRTTKEVVAADEIQAWALVKETLTTNEYWLEDAQMLRQVT